MFFSATKISNDVYANICKDKSPSSKPILLSAIPKDGSVTLTWSKAQDPVTHYLLAYGKSETNMEYGSQNIGGKETTTFTVDRLVNGVKYYFKLRPVNGCRPGDFSNKLSAIPGSNIQNKNKGDVVIVAPVPEKTPNLSIYKADRETTSSIETTKKNKGNEKYGMAVLGEKSHSCSSCISWTLIAIEIISLIVYLFFAGKFNTLNYIFSLVIPLAIYIIYYKFNTGCSLRQFSCKYFVPLDVIVYMVILIGYKNRKTVSKVIDLKIFSKVGKKVRKLLKIGANK